MHASRFFAPALVVWSLMTPGCPESETPSSPADATILPDGQADAASDSSAVDAAGPDGDVGVDAAPDVVDPPEPRMTLVVGETTRGFVDGVGRQARFEGITCMTIAPDGSALYVSDTFNGIVRRVDTATGEVTTIGGVALSFSTSDGVGASVRFTEPRGLGITDDGALLWIADGPALRSLDLNTGEAITWAGVPGEPGFVDGDAVEARLGFLVHDVEVSADGATVYLSDRSNDRIRAWDVAGETLSSIAGGGATGADGTGAAAGFDGNGGIVLDGTTLYIADTFSHTVRQLDLTTNAVTTVAGAAGQSGITDGDLATARLDSPQGVGFKDGMLYAAGFDGLVRRVDLAGDAVTTVPVTGLTGTFSPPVADPTANRLYYADLSTDAVFSIDLDSNAVTNIAGPVQPEGNIDGTLEEARFGYIYGVATSADGERMYIADPANSAVRVVDLTAGQVSTITDPAWDGPVGLALDDAGGRLFVGDANTGQLWTVTLADGTAAMLGAGGLTTPWGMALAEGTLYVAEYGGLTVQAVDIATGEASAVAGTGVAGGKDGVAAEATFRGPIALAWDGPSDTLYVADFAGNTIRTLNVSTGLVTTIAGDGSPGGDDGLPGRLNEPSGVALHNGRLFITDTSNHTVRAWDPETGLSTVVGREGVQAAIGAGPGVPVSDATLALPEAVAAGASGLFVSVEYGVMHVPWAALQERAP